MNIEKDPGYDGNENAAWRSDFDKHVLGRSISENATPDNPSMVEEYGLSKEQYFSDVVGRALSIRVIFACFGAWFIVALVLGTEGVGGFIAIAVAVLLWAGYSVAPNSPPSRCPYCRKRVKLGAEACHHCGRMVVTHVA